MWKLCIICIDFSIFWALKNPENSHAWHICQIITVLLSQSLDEYLEKVKGAFTRDTTNSMSVARRTGHKIKTWEYDIYMAVVNSFNSLAPGKFE